MATTKADTRLNEMQLRALVSSAPLGIVVINAQGVIQEANEETYALFGYEMGELINSNVDELVPEGVRARHPKLREGFFEHPSSRMMGAGRELNAKRKNGTEFPVEIGLAPISSEGEMLAVAFIIDVSEKRKAEETSRRLFQEIQEVSVPILSVWDGVIVLPLIGTLDSHRAQEAMEKALTRMADAKVRTLIVDITGVPVVDTMVANHLLRMATAVQLMGGEAILTGISPLIARTIVQLGVDLSSLKTRATLAQGLQLAIADN